MFNFFKMPLKATKKKNCYECNFSETGLKSHTTLFSSTEN